MTFTISGVRETGTITYHCPTRSSALAKLRDFHDANYADVTISADDGGAEPRTQLVTSLEPEPTGLGEDRAHAPA